MNGAYKILRHFIRATIFISIGLVILNFIMLGTLIFKGMSEPQGQSPLNTVKVVSEGLSNNGLSYSLDNEVKKLLEEKKAWAMLINKEGDVIWNERMPKEVPNTYSITDVAQFSRNYLMDYPVYVWEHSDELLVVGYPKDSFAKYQFNFPIEWVSSLPLRILSLIIINILLALLLSLLIGSRLIKSIKSIIGGIHALTEEKPVDIEPNGVLSDLAESVNYTSKLLEEKNTALRARDEARFNWIAGISHDIRTPLSIMLGYASSLEENEIITLEQRQQAGIIRHQGENLRSLVADLNMVSMLEYDMQPLNKKILKLSSLARQVASEFLNNGLEEKYTIELDVSEEYIKIDGDEKLLIRAITNLVQNSIIHNKEGCRILLQSILDEDKKTCGFIVSDDGKGMPQSEIPNLLELPYSSKRKSFIHNGHGLGLPMVSRIIKAHNGKFILESQEEKGFKAIIILPVIER
ncbi:MULTISPECIES: sensor histidine kinase [unclassified Clostridium]|uniref:sensor histidine kinase n=1 Tax=unclassified Clostridium TaxID=2614128 RepID=UPI000EBB6E75|nr:MULTISPECIES: HAMP domain-containing sensor histidine kinase [unclassified Clostridium]HCQ91370.1 two-component sensor histidine kinase [Clostridium sp.]